MEELIDQETGVILSSARDKRTLLYLIAQCGIERVANARAGLPGRKRPYVSNVAKALEIVVPEDVVITSREDGRRHLEGIRSLLEKKSKSE